MLELSSMEKISEILQVEKLVSNCDLVIFDLDDTLYLEKDYVKSGFAEVSKNFLQIKDMANKLWQAFELGKKPINSVLEEHGLLTQENLDLAISVYRNHLPNISLAEGVKDMLLRLKANGKKLGLITDGRPQGQRNKICALQIEDIFDKIIVTDELGGAEYRKPNPKAFEEMVKHFNLSYERSVYIGDNPKKDFIAPISLKMACIHFENPNGLYFGK